VTLEILSPSFNSAEAFLRRTSAVISLNEQESALLRNIASQTEYFDAGACIRSAAKMRSWIVAAGWAYYSRAAADGRQQIFSFIIPGDTIGIVDGPFEADKTEVRALTSVKLIDATAMRRASMSGEPYENIRDACEVERSLESVRLLDHLFRLGRLSAEERMAHLLLELNHRLEKVGLAHQGTFELPASQAQLGDCLGLSLVHINRVLQALRQERLIGSPRKRVMSLDLEGLPRRANPVHKPPLTTCD
jgi:CRP-like cAMP-binding protein